MVISGGVQGAGAGLSSGNPFIAGAGAGLGAFGDIFGASEPEYVSGLTDDQRDFAVNRYAKGFKRLEELNMAPYEVGGYTLRGGGRLSKEQVRKKNVPLAAREFLLSQGLSGPAADAQIENIQYSNRPSFKKNLGKDFLQYLRKQGGKHNLNVRKRKIRGREGEAIGGSFSADEGTAQRRRPRRAAPGAARAAAERIALLFSGGDF